MLQYIFNLLSFYLNQFIDIILGWILNLLAHDH